MVFIESVDINNFKSYHHTRQIGPLLSTTAIVGPNGSGKSNILDAITFAFGDVSKNLRVERLNQLIHTTSNESEDQCSVRIRVMFKLPDGEDDGHYFERRLKKNGTEEFFIDDKKYTKQEYLAFLGARGIFAKSDNFVIRQGSINRMINDGDNNRAKFIDVVSGGSEYEQPIKELQASYDKLLAKVKAHQEISQKNGRELNLLSVAHGKRKDIEEDMEKINVARTDYYLLNLYPLEKRYTTIEEKFQKQKAKLEKELTVPEEALLEAEKLKNEEIKKALTIERQHEAAKNKADAEHNTAEAKELACVKLLGLLDTKKATCQKLLKTVQAKTQERSKHHKKLQDNIKNLKAELEALEADYLQRSQKNINESQLAEFYDLQKTVDGHKISDDIRENEIRKERLESETQALKVLLALDQQRLEKKKRELDLLENNDDPERLHLENLRSELESLFEQIEQIEGEEAEKQRCTKELDTIIRQLSDEGHRIEYNRSNQLRDHVERELSDAFPGKMFGVFRKICTPVHESYTLAAARVCQKWKNAFIVDSPQTAEACIQILKAKKYPRQKFIPVDSSLRIKNVSPDVQKKIDRKEAQLVRKFFTVHHKNPNVERAVHFVCGNTLFCNTMEEARNVAYGLGPGHYLTVVSKDGTIFKKGGVIAGGSGTLFAQGDPFSSSQAEQLMQRKQELMTSLREMRRGAEGLLANKRSREKELRARIEHLETSRPASNATKAQRIQDSKNDIAEIENSIAKREADLTQYENEYSEVISKLKDLNKRKEELTKETFASFCLKNNIDNLQSFQDGDIDRLKVYGERKEEIEKEIQKYENEILYADSPTDELERANDVLKKVESEFETANAEWMKVKEENKGIRNTYLNINKIYEASKVELESLFTELEKIKADLKKSKDIKKKIDKASKEKEAAFTSILNEIQKLFFECRIKQVSLPLLNENFENVELFESAESQSTDNIRITPVDCKGDYSRFDDDPTQLTDNEKRKKLIESKAKKITEIEKQLAVKESGALSSEEYKEKLDRARENEKVNLDKFSKLSKELNEAKRKLNEVKDKRSECFMATFNKMKKDVDYYYKLLYGDQTVEAHLNIVGTGEPYSSKVQFDLVAPGKGRSPLENQSGGEKAMAALALLFAGKPRNVNCVLMDEFDEALDRRNMRSVTRFIQNMSSRSIQVIFVSHRIEVFAHANLLIGSVTHCNSACNYGSIIYSIDVRNFMSNEAQVYDPDAEDEIQKKRQATEEFKRAMQIDELPEPTQGTIEARTAEVLDMYATHEVRQFLQALETEDAYRHCPNDENIVKIKEMFARFAFGDN